MRVNKRALLVACGIAAVTGVAFAAFEHERDSRSSDVVGATVKRASREGNVADAQHHVQASAGFDLRSLRHIGPIRIRTSSLLAPRSWYVPPPPPPAPKVAVVVAPPPPSAPQVPFTYIGRMIDGKRVVIFLLKNDVQYMAQLDDVLDGTYRVDKIADNTVVLTYMPMNVQQTLELRRDAPGAGAIQLADRAQGIAPPASIQPPQQRSLSPFVKQ